MPTAALLLREDSGPPLSTLVEKSQQRKPPLPQVDIHLTATHLDLVRRPDPPDFGKPPADEGFESDVDTVSIVSSDGSFVPEAGSKTTETDSANGSASSDSDTDNAEPARECPRETHSLVDCVCYTDVKFPDLLVFVIKREALVFRFDDLNTLRSFYLNFTALKAVANQKAYSKNAGARFNLLQRTDSNGVTHIEITREPETNLFSRPTDGPTSIISLNTPESNSHPELRSKTLNTRALDKDGRSKDANSRQRNESVFLGNYRTLHSSSENILNLVNDKPGRQETTLRKVWNSAEDLLDAPKRPERRKKLKGKAPPPPVPPAPTPDVLRGEYVRVNVNVAKDKDFIAKSQLKERPVAKSNLVTLLTPRPKPEPPTRPSAWTNSVPRLMRKPRSRSETRPHFTPMAYRYIDTVAPPTYTPQMGNRLFGLSPKLREFPSEPGRWGDAGFKQEAGGNLKSVIKKDENHRKKNEKKVTFSAYTTVQVV